MRQKQKEHVFGQAFWGNKLGGGGAGIWFFISIGMLDKWAFALFNVNKG